jgi:hypothetical protein
LARALQPLAQLGQKSPKAGIVQGLSRDNLDENGGGNQSLKAAAGSEVMIALGPEGSQAFCLGAAFDCRCGSISLFP